MVFTFKLVAVQPTKAATALRQRGVSSVGLSALA